MPRYESRYDPAMMPQNLEHVRYEKKEHVAYVTINRPEVRNALHTYAYAELRSCWLDIARDPDIYVGIVTGAGDAFCAGRDVKFLSENNVGLGLAGGKQADFVVLVLNTLDHNELCDGTDFAGLRINLATKLAARFHGLLGRGQEGILDCLHEHITFDASLALEVVQHGDEFGVHIKSYLPGTKKSGFGAHFSGAGKGG